MSGITVDAGNGRDPACRYHAGSQSRGFYPAAFGRQIFGGRAAFPVFRGQGAARLPAYCHNALAGEDLLSHHGTGDLFASTVAGAVLNNWSIPDALALAADYTLECIKYTISDENANWYGVNFEQAIPYLIHRLGK